MKSSEYGDNPAISWAAFLAGAGIGAAFMYLIDPNTGARRRGVLRDRMIHASHEAAGGLDAARRDLANRAYTWAETRTRREGARRVPSVEGATRAGNLPKVLQQNWSPATRTLIGSVGSALVAYAVARRDLFSTLFGLAGTALVLRAATNLQTRQMVGAGAGRRDVDVEKTIHINAPVSSVFAFWSAFENFPRFMTNVREVRTTNVEGQSHWTIAGLGRAPIEFDAVVTRFSPNEVIAWTSVEGSPVAHTGIVRFEADEAGGTRVHIRFSYNPPGGTIGYAFAALMGNDPKTKMEEDLARMKTLIETGHPPRDAAQALRNPSEGLM